MKWLKVNVKLSLAAMLMLVAVSTALAGCGDDHRRHRMSYDRDEHPVYVERDARHDGDQRADRADRRDGHDADRGRLANDRH